MQDLRTAQPLKVHMRRSRFGFRGNLALLSMLIPGLIILFVNNYMPMLGIVIAFKQYRFVGNFVESIIKSQWVGFNNFKIFFDTPYAFMMTRNTILYNLAFIILDIVIPVFFAISLNEIRGRMLSKTYQSIMFLPYFLSWSIVSYLAFSMLSIDKGFVRNDKADYVQPRNNGRYAGNPCSIQASGRSFQVHRDDVQ